MKASPIKRVAKEKVAILHSCTEKETLNRMSQLLVGNGHPEDGYVYKVIEMSKSISAINEKLTGITGIVKELHEESLGNKAVKSKKSVIFEIAIKIVGAAVAILMLYIGYRNLETRIDKIGVPIVTNSRGEILMLPDSTRLLFSPNDSIKYTIVKDKY